MEQIPNDLQAEQVLLADIARYCGQAYEAEGLYVDTTSAVADFLVRQFSFTYDDAVKFVRSAGYFDENDTSGMMYEKAALAPLVIADDLIEMRATLKIGLHDGDQTGLMTFWYSDLASTALGMTGPLGHSSADCCIDSEIDGLWQNDMACNVSDACVFRMTRQFLLNPALQPNLEAIADETDELLQHLIVEAKLSAAVDCEFITCEQKEALDDSYVEQVASWRGQ